MSYCFILRPILKPLSNASQRIFRSSFATYRNPTRQLCEPQQTEHLSTPASKLFESDAFKDIRRSEKIWKFNKDNQSFKKYYKDCFKKHEFSPDYVVSLMRTACNVCMCSPDLIFSMLMTLNDCVHENNVVFEPTYEQQAQVLTYILKYTNNQLSQSLCNLFKLNKNSGDFKQFVEDLVSEKKFVEASICIWVLNLQKDFDVNQIAVPLLIEGKIVPVIYYLSNHPDLQMSVAKGLDELLVTPGNLKDNVQPISSKVVFKALTSIVNSLKLPPENFKNLCYIRGRAAINVLIRRRRGKLITEDVWEGMIMSIVNDNPELKKHLVYKLIAVNDKETALQMLPKLGMQDFDISSIESKVNISKLDDFDEGSDEKLGNEGSTTGHLTFELTVDDVKYIDTVEKFIHCINDISQNYRMLGIDSEWKANFGLSQDRLSLVQMAVHDKVYILDMLSLNDCLSPDHWDMLLDNIFGNPNIIKLGCGIMADVQMIVENNRGSKGKVTFTHILDMAVFYDKLEEVYPEKLGITDPKTSSKNTKGLSTLCELLLGKPLNKEVRLCDWEQRPLTDTQLEYAALDAHCLLKMFDSLKAKASEHDMNFDHLVKVAIYLTNQSWKPRRNYKGVSTISNERVLQIQKPINIDTLRLLVESSLKEHGEKLRQLGADVLILKETDSAQIALKISKFERRILLCSDALWNQIKDKNANAFHVNEVPEGQSITFAVLRKYNARMKSKNIFSRCQACNSMDGVRMSSDIINLMEGHSSVKDLTDEENTENLQAILEALTESGISIKYSNEKDVLLSKGYAFLCTKCGTVQ